MSRKIGDVIRSLRLEHDMNQSEFAKMVNVAPATVSQWESNVREPSKSKMEEICDYFNVDMNYLYGITTVRNNYRDGRDIFQVPLYSTQSIIESQGTIPKDDILDYIVIPKFILQEGKRYFAIIMQDSSMIGCGLRENDIAIFEFTSLVQKHEVACVFSENQVYIRHFIPSDDDVELFSTNRFYQNYICKHDNMIVLGKLALSITNHQW